MPGVPAGFAFPRKAFLSVLTVRVIVTNRTGADHPGQIVRSS